MRITAREYARRYGLADRVVRSKLSRGTLPGSKERDPRTGVETWWVEVPGHPDDIEEDHPGLQCNSGLDHPDPRIGLQPDDPDTDPVGLAWGFAELLRDKERQIAGKDARIEELATQVGELRAREGFALLQLAEARKQLMAATPPVVVELEQQIAHLNNERAELYGRLGYFQAQLEAARGQLQAAQTRILELEAPKNSAPAEMANYPTYVQNGASSGSEKTSKGPWWRFWRWYQP